MKTYVVVYYDEKKAHHSVYEVQAASVWHALAIFEQLNVAPLMSVTSVQFVG
jgi:hypothetical protein